MESRALQFKPPLSNFLLPHPHGEKRWLSDLVQSSEGKRVALPESEWIANASSGEDYDRLRMAFGLAGAYDRTQVEEVAKTELSLIRHNLLLRRLVMRYMKALLLVIWTTLVVFGLVSWLGVTKAHNPFLVIGMFFLVWSGFAPLWVRSPVRWIYREFDLNSPDSTRDPHLVSFERFVTWCCLAATFCGMVAVIWHLGSALGWFGSIGLILGAAAILRSYGQLDNPEFKWL